MTDRRGDWMQTYTGRKFWPFDPRASEVAIADIAHHLAQDCRFAGATTDFYSVAQHSVLVSHVVERLDPALGPHGLLHDAHEAYLRDRIRPVKRSMRQELPRLAAALDNAEAALQRTIEQRFGLLAPRDVDVAAIERADLIALATERRDLLVPTGEPWITDGVEPCSFRLLPLAPRDAERAFLERFAELFPGVAHA